MRVHCDQNVPQKYVDALTDAGDSIVAPVQGQLAADAPDTDILPRLKSWGSTVTDRSHDGEVPHSFNTVGLWAVPVRPPTEIAGFIYRHGGVRILTSDSVV